MNNIDKTREKQWLFVPLANGNRNLRRVSYRQAEHDACRLAAELVAAYGYNEVTRFHYAGIPRGGLIVLSLLSYALDLGWDALPPHSFNSPLVVVDDCSLSGARFGYFLDTIETEEVIFAHLYSHPDLRKAIMEREPRVIACLAARNLRDVSRENYPNEQDYLAWRERWQMRLPDRRYWAGQPEHLIFPWTEPDHLVWNPQTKKVEDGWRLASPDRCLKNRALLGVPLKHLDHHATLRVPDDVAYHLEDDRVMLCNLKTDKVYGFDEVAAEMWRALAAYGSAEPAVAHLLAQYNVPENQLRKDLSGFIDQLLSEGLLERS